MGFPADERNKMREEDKKSGSDTTTPDRIIIGVEKNVSDIPQTVKDRAPAGSTFIRADETLGFGVVELPDSVASVDAIDSVESKPDVRYAEEDARGRALFTPNDSKYGNQYAPQQINAPEAWDTTLGSSEVTICVLDTGVKYDHPDLSPNIADNLSNGGKDFVDSDDDPYPEDLDGNDGDGNEETHGTHVAGIAAAVTNNSTGVSGISNATILCARVLDEDGTGWYSDMASGITWATDEGADIINMSLGGSSHSATLEDACDYARNNGTLPIAAAGNDEKEYGVVYDGNEYHQYPAEFSSVMCVTAVNNNENFASYSSYGNAVDITAPGSWVYSTYPIDSDGNMADTYSYLSGTSMATPVVSGVAALTLSADQSLSVSELENILESTARDIDLLGKKQGAGHVDAQAAVEESLGAVTVSVTDETATVGGTADISVTAENADQVTITDIWTDWSVDSTNTDGGTFDERISSAGHCTFSWDTTVDSASPTITLNLPSRYEGGTYALTVTASRSVDSTTDETSATMTIS